jgi:hypothetical protein
MAEWDETIEVRLEFQSELTCVSADAARAPKLS